MQPILGKRVGEPRVDIFEMKRYPSEIIEDPRTKELAVPEVELQQPPQLLIQSLADNKKQNEE